MRDDLGFNIKLVVLVVRDSWIGIADRENNAEQKIQIFNSYYYGIIDIELLDLLNLLSYFVFV